jgi:hypothetical protein
MKTTLLLTALLLLGAGACSTTPPPATAQALFNGRDLSGWVVMHGGDWTVEDGVLVGRNGRGWSTDPKTSGSWLRSTREYENFILDLEFAIEGNSGVFLRAGLERNPAFTGYEMQIVSDAGRPPTKGSSGGLYDVIAPLKNMARPTGQWNQVRILVEGPRIQVVWGGELVVDYDDAIRTARGYIGLQTHDEKSVVRFRSVRLTELPGGPAPKR